MKSARRRRRFGLLAALWALLALPPSGLSAQSVSGGIIGSDDRVLLESTQAPWRSVGKVNIAGERFCTGTLIAADLVVTAAHCVVWPGSGRVRPLSSIHFVAGRQGERYLDHARARAVTLHPAFDVAGLSQLSARHRDLAVIRLERPLSPAPLAPLALSSALGQPVDYVFYSKDRRYRLSRHAGCAALEERHGIWLLNCDTVEGGSGGPVFAPGAAGDRPVAIVVGYASGGQGTLSIAVPLKELAALGLEIETP